jgi:hypothetical protein
MIKTVSKDSSLCEQQPAAIVKALRSLSIVSPIEYIKAVGHAAGLHEFREMIGEAAFTYHMQLYIQEDETARQRSKMWGVVRHGEECT